jgi:hypothetical protein
VLRLLEQYYRFKYLTIPWLHYLSNIQVEYSVFRKYLGYLRQVPNNYLVCPEQQNASPNVDRKTLVYQLGERGLNELLHRGDARGHIGQNDRDPLKPSRNFSWAVHRSHSYYHEIVVDLGYFAPLHRLVRDTSSLRLIDFERLMTHPHVPAQTRQASDPLLIQLKDAQLRFDGTPHLLIFKRTDGTSRTIGIPGIQVDRGTESLPHLGKHLMHAMEFIENRHFELHWGFDNCVVPFLFTSEARKRRAMEFVRRERGLCTFLLFQSVPDIGLLRRFPPLDEHVFTHPWERVGYSDLDLSNFGERASNENPIAG